MIISASRRTDIPAFYSDWFINRLCEGYVRLNSTTQILLDPTNVDCIVFWTKDAYPMLKHLDILDELGYKYYFQFTVNPYGIDIEKNVPSKTAPNGVVDTFIALSNRIGRNRVIWRYDPILLTNAINLDFHRTRFEYLASKLSDYTDRCVFSFIDYYKKVNYRMQSVGLIQYGYGEEVKIAEQLVEIASAYGLKLATCSEAINLSNLGIEHNSCIDINLINDLCGHSVPAAKDLRQRSRCGCVKSIDIGVYNTCKHGCLYCYAND